MTETKEISRCPVCNSQLEKIPLSPSHSDYVCWNCGYTQDISYTDDTS